MENLKVGIYKHFKGNEYMMLYVATNTETTEKMVVYRALYGDMNIWVRPLSMWNEQITVDGALVPRFKYIGDDC